VPIPADGRATRVHIAADADGVSIRAARLGLPLVPAEDPAEWPEVPEDMLLGDPMVVRIRRGGGEAGTGEVRYEVTTFEQEVRFMSHRWPEGAPLVAPAGGFGHRRATPDLRRFFSIAAALLEPGDPVGYAPHHSLDPLTYDYDPDVEPGCHVLHVPTIGDMNVPVNTGIAMARAGGALTAAEHRRLIDAWVVEAVEGLDRYTDNQGTGVLIDADDLSDDTDQFADREVPRLDPPLRATHEDDLGGASGMRLPYVRPSGAHGIGPPKPTLPFDVNTYTINVIGRFFELRGAPGSILDERCLADDSCDYILPPPE